MTRGCIERPNDIRMAGSLHTTYLAFCVCWILFQKVRVTNLIQGGIKAMEKLEKLEKERRTTDAGEMCDSKNAPE